MTIGDKTLIIDGSSQLSSCASQDTRRSNSAMQMQLFQQPDRTTSKAKAAILFVMQKYSATLKIFFKFGINRCVDCRAIIFIQLNFSKYIFLFKIQNKGSCKRKVPYSVSRVRLRSAGKVTVTKARHKINFCNTGAAIQGTYMKFLTSITSHSRGQWNVSH